MDNKKLRQKDLQLICSRQELERLPEGKILINTINERSYHMILKD